MKKSGAMHQPFSDTYHFCMNRDLANVEKFIKDWKNAVEARGLGSTLIEARNVERKPEYLNKPFLLLIKRVSQIKYNLAERTALGMDPNDPNPPLATDSDYKRKDRYDQLMNTQTSNQEQVITMLWNMMDPITTQVNLEFIKENIRLSFLEKIVGIQDHLMTLAAPTQDLTRAKFLNFFRKQHPVSTIRAANLMFARFAYAQGELGKRGANQGIPREEYIQKIYDNLNHNDFKDAKRWYKTNKNDADVGTPINFLLEVRHCFPDNESHLTITGEETIKEFDNKRSQDNEGSEDDDREVKIVKAATRMDLTVSTDLNKGNSQMLANIQEYAQQEVQRQMAAQRQHFYSGGAGEYYNYGSGGGRGYSNRSAAQGKPYDSDGGYHTSTGGGYMSRGGTRYNNRNERNRSFQRGGGRGRFGDGGRGQGDTRPASPSLGTSYMTGEDGYRYKFQRVDDTKSPSAPPSPSRSGFRNADGKK